MKKTEAAGVLAGSACNASRVKASELMGTFFCCRAARSQGSLRRLPWHAPMGPITLAGIIRTSLTLSVAVQNAGWHRDGVLRPGTRRKSPCPVLNTGPWDLRARPRPRPGKGRTHGGAKHHTQWHRDTAAGGHLAKCSVKCWQWTRRDAALESNFELP